MSDSKDRKASVNKITINQGEFVWGENGGVTYFGVDAILFWIKPSLMSILQPLSEELGEDLYSRLVAFEASKGTYEDYHTIVSTMGKTFEEGFGKWGEAVSACGWGQFQILEMVWDQPHAVIRIDNAWELGFCTPKNLENYIPFLRGKISGIFSHAFKTNCLAQVREVSVGSEISSVILEVAPSKETLEKSLMQVKSRKGQENLRAVNNALRRNQRRFLDVIETLGEFIWESDLNLRITYATEHAHEVMRLSQGDVVGASWESLLQGPQAQRLRALLDTLKSDSKIPYVEEEFVLHTLGGPRWLLFRIKRLQDFSENHIGYIGSTKDISVERELRERLKEQQTNAEYSAKMATLGEMAGGIAHEINTPLAVISLQAEQFMIDLKRPHWTPEKAEKAMEVILSTTDRIAKIVQGLRTFARDATHDPMVAVPLSYLYQETLILCKNRLGVAGVRLDFIPPDPKLMIFCRATQISQVLLNLINNSFDAIASLPEKWIEVLTMRNDKWVEIRVRDSGRGIPEEIREKMMHPFFTTKPVGQGTGLGLSISKGIVEAHGGELLIDTTDANTCFVIRLPVRPQP